MTKEEFNKLSIEEQNTEMEKCKSFEYFYTNYCWKEGMPIYSKEAYQSYLEMAERYRYAIGNTRRGKALRDGLIPCGEKSVRATLTEKQVLEIRDSNLSHTELAKIYNTGRTNIIKIVNRQRWKHI